MDLLIAALLGVLQGLTEFLPISSTAHLLLAGDLLGYEDPGGVFTVMIQLGSILAVMWLYRGKIAAVARGLPSDPDARRFAFALLLGFMPALLAGAVLAGYVKTVLYNSPAVIAVAFIVGGFVMLAVERLRPAPRVDSADAISPGRAFAVGAFQVLALVPGVSRSGATIVGGMLLRLDRPAAAEFSFFLAMPTMIAAFVHDLIEVGGRLAPDRVAEIAVGFIAAFVAAAAVVKPFLRFVGRTGFWPFAWYRVALGALLLGAIAMGRL